MPPSAHVVGGAPNVKSQLCDLRQVPEHLDFNLLMDEIE